MKTYQHIREFSKRSRINALPDIREQSLISPTGSEDKKRHEVMFKSLNLNRTEALKAQKKNEI